MNLHSIFHYFYLRSKNELVQFFFWNVVKINDI